MGSSKSKLKDKKTNQTGEPKISDETNKNLEFDDCQIDKNKSNDTSKSNKVVNESSGIKDEKNCKNDVSVNLDKIANETNNKSDKSKKCTTSGRCKGIICNAAHICRKESIFRVPDISDEELTEHLVKSVNNAVNYSDSQLSNEEDDANNEEDQIVIKTVNHFLKLFIDNNL